MKTLKSDSQIAFIRNLLLYMNLLWNEKGGPSNIKEANFTEEHLYLAHKRSTPNVYALRSK